MWGSAYDVGIGDRAPIVNFFARHEGKLHPMLSNESRLSCGAEFSLSQTQFYPR